MTFKKDDLVRSLYGKVGLSKGQSMKTVESLFSIMKETLASGEGLLISGFGKFIARNKAQRKGRNPARGEALILEARRVVRFRSSPVLVDKINGKI
jgi:integration host factor subunit alpha